MASKSPSGVYLIPGHDAFRVEVWWDRYTRSYVGQILEVRTRVQVGNAEYRGTRADAFDALHDLLERAPEAIREFREDEEQARAYRAEQRAEARLAAPVIRTGYADALIRSAARAEGWKL